MISRYRQTLKLNSKISDRLPVAYLQPMIFSPLLKVTLSGDPLCNVPVRVNLKE